MNEALKTIITRRSIRKYVDQPISEDQVQWMLRAAMNAPSAGNEQPWEFLVITNRDKLKKVPEFHPYSKMLPGAALAILVVADPSKVKYEEELRQLWIQDCSAATQNILLAAHSLGLGAVWLAVYPDSLRLKGIRELFNIPEEMVPFSIVSLGYPVGTKLAEDHYDETRIHREVW
ncbi:NADPH nitroreductase [Desulfosporosinus sp. I2]|uniref:nitroreductase family protein n=1 Tax=Desulfosporosinus sp. I2 TaxID=1617025 RepID=UPI0005EE07DF|nr:nitroreductase family protein [Desulfosporosinus sp. I2]KJR47179.1 NADPH nitroreductase [Desulfosporosinus sp. I2]